MQRTLTQRPMDAIALKTALIRAETTQLGLARKLGKNGRGIVAGWVRANRVPPEWVPIVYEKLGLPIPPPVLAAFNSVELLEELLERENRRGVSVYGVDVDNRSGPGKNADTEGRPPRGQGEGPPDL